MKKRFFSLFLALCMIFSMTVFAEDYSTTITLEGTATESWTFTVPATIDLDVSSPYIDISVEGYWPSWKNVLVTIPEEIEFNLMDGDTDKIIVVPVEFELTGSDYLACHGCDDGIICLEECVLIDTSDLSKIIFGTWSGTLNFTVEMDE